MQAAVAAIRTQTKTIKTILLEKVELYSLLCDVIERAYQHSPVDSWKDGHSRYTGDCARAAANRAMEELERLSLLVIFERYKAGLRYKECLEAALEG